MIAGQMGMNDGSVNISEFYARGAIGPWQKWTKPAGVKMVYIFCMGGGSGGGNGFTGAAGTARGGGGGGAGSGNSKLLVPAFFLPDTLNIQVGLGGAANTAGNLSYVSLYEKITNLIYDTILVSGAAAATAGGNGSGTAGGTSGNAGTIATIASAYFANLGIWTPFAGSGGGVGGAQTGANGSNATSGMNITTGGGGGAGTPIANTNYVGGSVYNSQSGVPFLSSVAGAGLDGSHGCNNEKPFMTWGGVGGNSNGASGVGGKGGDGGLGSGGGGGGAGVTGGAGGRGGDGYVLIICW